MPTPVSVYDNNGSLEDVQPPTSATKTYKVGDTKTFASSHTSTNFKCVGVGGHCYIWMDDDVYNAYSDTNRTTAINSIINTFDNWSYEKFLKPYGYDKYIKYFDGSDKLSIVFLKSNASASGYFNPSQEDTTIYIPTSTNDLQTDFWGQYILYAHEAQHAMTYSQSRISGLWLDEGLSVTIMDNRNDWMKSVNGNTNIANGSPIVNTGYKEDTTLIYGFPALFIRYLNAQANGGNYLYAENCTSGDSNAAYRKFYSYFYATNVPSDITDYKKGIYVIEYLMQDYHKNNKNLFSNSDGSCWNFNDLLRNFRIALMMQESSGKYSMGSPGVSSIVPYYPMYAGTSGKAVQLYGTGAIIVKTQNGQFTVP